MFGWNLLYFFLASNSFRSQWHHAHELHVCVCKENGQILNMGLYQYVFVIQVSSPTIIVERAGSFAWTHRSWRVREEFARTVTSAINLFASTELPLQRAILPPVWSKTFLIFQTYTICINSSLGGDKLIIEKFLQPDFADVEWPESWC
jgi:hypothetical protein